ncbi:MAG: FliH/SctL family protein [Planctomycetota bacterium]|jgi:flagellar biosynthesis/type III secretory pathway protein FliH
MSRIATVNLNKPISSAKVLSDYAGVDGSQLSGPGANNLEADTAKTIKQDSESQKAAFSQACQTLNGVIDKLNAFYEKIFVAHSEEIARLSLEIARKILMQKVEDGDYEIESIVKESLQNAPDRHDVVVHLHPDDVAQCQRAQQDDPDSALAGIKFVSDSNIGRAECLLESPKGIVKSLIDENLERIGRALKNKQ